MDMSITSATSANTSQVNGSAAWQQQSQAFSALSQALQSGDLAGAQKAFATISSNAPSGASSNPNSPLAQLGQALKAGDLAGAQKAFAAMRGHHHHHSGGTSATSSTSTTPGVTTSGSAGDSIGTLVNVTA